MQAAKTVLMALIFLAMLVAVSVGLSMRHRRELGRLQSNYTSQTAQLTSDLGQARRALAACRLPRQAAAEQVEQLAASAADLEARIAEVKRSHELSRKETEAGLERLSMEIAELRSQLRDIEGALSRSMDEASRVEPSG
jgi:septal ring factor EnvC (AmiA/AmiB activator)